MARARGWLFSPQGLRTFWCQQRALLICLPCPAACCTQGTKWLQEQLGICFWTPEAACKASLALAIGTSQPSPLTFFACHGCGQVADGVGHRTSFEQPLAPSTVHVCRDGDPACSTEKKRVLCKSCVRKTCAAAHDNNAFTCAQVGMHPGGLSSASHGLV
jgi:hypothetical protein